MIDIEKITITAEMLSLISTVDEFKGAWRLLGKLAPDRLSSLKHIATIESIGSSTRIEGSKLSDRAVEALLSRLDAKSFQSRDEQEVAGYSYACEMVYENFDAIAFSENTIKQMHAWLLKYSEKDERHRGEYKKIPIKIEAFDSHGKSLGIVFETASPFETPIKMQELVNWTAKALDEKIIHPLITIGLFIVVFLAIHPFQDGNGRLSRLLSTFLMMKMGYQYVPYSSLESVIEANKESYYLALQKTQIKWVKGQPEWTPWLLFFMQCLLRQKEHLEVKISREKILLNELPGLSKLIIELLEKHGRLGIRELEQLTQANRNTLKKTLSVLVQDNHIKLNGRGRASWYSLI